VTKGDVVPASSEQGHDRDLRLRANVEKAAGRALTDEGWRIFFDKEVGDDEPYSPELVEVLAELLSGYDLVSERPASRRITTHTASDVRGDYEAALTWFATRRVPLPVKQFRRVVLHDHLLHPRRARSWLTRKLAAESDERGLPSRYRALVSVPVDTLLPVFSIPVIELRDPVNGRDYWAQVASGTDTDWLRRISEGRAVDMGWTKAEATLWVITGVPPAMEMIRTVFHPAPRDSLFGERIEMTIEPGTPPRDVMNAYNEVRSAIAGRRVRLQSPKHLRLAMFADQRPEGETWRESMRRWNEIHPRSRYSRVSNFWRDAVHAHRRFLEQRPFARDAEGA
jgi:hypothetical protein